MWQLRGTIIMSKKNEYYYIWNIMEREDPSKRKERYFIWKHRNGCYYGYYSETQEIFNKIKDFVTRPYRIKKNMEKIRALRDLIDARCQADTNLDNDNRYIKGFDLGILPMEFYYYSKYGNNDWCDHERMLRDNLSDNPYYSSIINELMEASVKKLDEFGDTVVLESLGHYGAYKAKNKNGEKVIFAIDRNYVDDKKEVRGYHIEILVTTISKNETKCC